MFQEDPVGAAADIGIRVEEIKDTYLNLVILPIYDYPNSGII